MRKKVTYTKRFYKSVTFEVDLHESLSEEEILDFLNSDVKAWEQVSGADLEFEDREIYILEK